MFKNIIFDWSGVIKDAVDAQLWTVNKMFESVGLTEISIEEMKENWEQPYMLFYNKYMPGWSLDDEKEAYYKAISREDYPRSHPYTGIVELIKKLNKKGVQMVILSSDSTSNIFSEIKQFGLENIFKEVVVDIHDKSEKIHELAKRNKFNYKETVFIGDSNHEVEVGKEAGVETIAVTWGFCTEEKLKSTNPDFLVHNIKELEKVLL
jgi:phosphoglycolate phosphatase